MRHRDQLRRAAGDLLTDGIGDTYAYNVLGRMTSSNGAQYVQDGLGQTVAKIGGANAAEIVYFAGRPIAFRDPSSGGYTDLIWAGGSLIAEVAGTETATPSYRLVNQVGTLVMTTDNSGAVTGTNRMTPYGRVLSSNATDPFLFAGLLADTNGTDAARVRNYATAPARWLRPDPYRGSYDLANPQSFNRYMYVNGNPLAFGDPSGLDFNFYCGPGCVGVFGEIPTLGPITSTLSALLGRWPHKPNPSESEGLACVGYIFQRARTSLGGVGSQPGLFLQSNRKQSDEPQKCRRHAVAQRREANPPAVVPWRSKRVLGAVRTCRSFFMRRLNPDLRSWSWRREPEPRLAGRATNRQGECGPIF